MFEAYYKFAKLTTLIAVFFVLLLLLTVNGLEFISQSQQYQYLLNFCFYFITFILLCVFYNKYHESILPRLHTFFLNESDKQSKLLDSYNQHSRHYAIIIAAALSLFFELAMIRWQSSLFPVFAMYKNFTLLACFAGLGAGYAMSRIPQIPLLLVAPLTAVMFSLFIMLRYGSGVLTPIFFMLPIREETSVFSFAETLSVGKYIFSLLCLHMLLGISFFFTALIFYPVGQLCGRLMTGLPNLRAYALNLIGSILGIILLVWMSYMWMPPLLWMVVVMLGIYYFLRETKESLYIAAISTLVMMTAISWPVESYIHQIYSPYQLIERTATNEGLMQIFAAGKYYQKVYDFSLGHLNTNEKSENTKIENYYELPFSFSDKLNRVAVVGSGSGNDVAAALRMGVQHIDAIEIDPAIQYLGQYYHPEHPYANPRVRTFIDDARTFFHKATPGYDLIVYGVLDSHTLLSHASNVRIDSFVYTQEGLQDAFALLNNGGLMALAFCIPNDLLGFKIYSMMENLPSAGKPIAIQTGYDKDSTTTFIVKKGGDILLPTDFFEKTQFKNLTAHFANLKVNVDIPTDDWPFFYMPNRVYPVSAIAALGLMLLLSYFFVKGMTNVNVVKFNPIYLPAFFMGAGFMLVETKALTEFGLYFGNTWIILAIAIISILMMAYLANLIILHFQITSMNLIFLFLLISLSFGYYSATHGKLLDLSPSLYFLVVVLLTSPLFFSGLAFSKFLNKSESDIAYLMSYNLLGALLGILLEYNSMYFGFSFLYLLAIALYSMAWMTALKYK